MKITFKSNVGMSLQRRSYATQRVGLELEYEKASAKTETLARWNQVTDYSLRTGGVEFVSTPLLESQLEPEIKAMIDVAKGQKAKPTIRCGMHAHINVTYMTFEQMFQFVIYNTLLEPALFAEFAPGRDQSHFCVPTYLNTALVEFMYKDGMKLRHGMECPNEDFGLFLRGSTSGHMRGKLTICNTPKYAALNMSSLKRFGTLEFRYMPSTLDYRKILNWSLLLLRIQRESMKYDSPEAIVAQYEADGILTLCEKVDFSPSRLVDTLDQEDAADAATIMAGHMPVDYNHLNWEIA